MISIDEDAAVAITLDGDDVDGDELIFYLDEEPQHGAIGGIAPNLVYTPAANYHGEDSFTFKSI